MMDEVIDLVPFSDPFITAKGESRASVSWSGLSTLWLNTGTLCNIQCANCYIESSPTNDRLVYLTRDDVMPFLDEVDGLAEGAKEIGITGGEPFMCPEILPIMEEVLRRGHRLLVLTNAMQPMMRPKVRAGLQALHHRFGPQMTLRVSLDHHSEHAHDKERGEGAYAQAILGLSWLSDQGIQLAIAGRQAFNEEETSARAAYGALIARLGLDIDSTDPTRLVLFPEMTSSGQPPEITNACWNILNVNPKNLMCASQRMVVRKRGATAATVMPCTLLAYEERFELGDTLLASTRDAVPLNHRWCAEFCVLGGGSCSA